MNDLDDVPLKNLIAQALENCHDNDLLDLVYKLLSYEEPTK
jgi:hypothetical protein